MNNFYQQLNLSFSNYDESLLKGPLHTTYPGLSYYHIADPDVYTQLASVCPLETRYISYIEITDHLAPHRDHNGTVVLNYYIQSGPAKTLFYTARNQNHIIINNSPVYSMADCKWQCSFMAKNNSAYLLNVSEIHSVIMIGKFKRTALSFGFPNHSYQEIAQALQKFWC